MRRGGGRWGWRWEEIEGMGLGLGWCLMVLLYVFTRVLLNGKFCEHVVMEINRYSLVDQRDIMMPLG